MSLKEVAKKTEFSGLRLENFFFVAKNRNYEKGAIRSTNVKRVHKMLSNDQNHTVWSYICSTVKCRL